MTISYPISVNGTLTRVIEAGDGPAMIALHGLGARADRWRQAMDYLAKLGRRVIAVDLPGHGFAQKGAGFDYSMKRYERFLGELLDTFYLPKADFLGASFGGQIATMLANSHPERVSSLFLIGSTGMTTLGAEAREKMSKMLVDMSQDAIRQRLTRGLKRPSEDLFVEEFRINNSPGAAESFAALGELFRTDIDNHQVVDLLASISDRLPVHLIWGDADLSIPAEIAEAAAPKIAGSTLTIIPNTAHSPYVDEPEVFSGVIARHLSSSSA